MSKIKLAKIQSNKEKALKLLNENIDLEYEIILKSFHRTSEIQQNFGTKKNPRFGMMKLGYKFENFKDEDTNEIIQLERTIVYEVEGKPTIDQWNPIRYYTISDV